MSDSDDSHSRLIEALKKKPFEEALVIHGQMIRNFEIRNVENIHIYHNEFQRKTGWTVDELRRENRKRLLSGK